MNYYFNEVITKESINDLVEKITNTEGKINLWFSTEGGDVTPMYFLASNNILTEGIRLYRTKCKTDLSVI